MKGEKNNRATRCTCHECYKAGYCPYVYDLQNIDSNCISRRNEGEF
jgi:hypothetical protein